MTDLAVPSIYVKGRGAEQKIQIALRVWAQQKPWEVRQFINDCRDLKSRMKNEKGYWEDPENGKKDTDMATLAITPPWPEFLLGKSDFETQFLYGVKCGFGNKQWRTDPELNRIFKRELECGVLSTMRT